MLTDRQLLAEGFVSIADAAKYLGISRTRMYELLRARIISHARHGNKLVVPNAALKEYAKGSIVRGSVA